MKKLSTILKTAAVTTIAFAGLAFTNMNAPSANGDGTVPGGEVAYYYYVSPGGTHYHPYDPSVNYGCNAGPYPCIIKSDRPLGPTPATSPSDAVIDVVAYRMTL